MVFNVRKVTKVFGYCNSGEEDLIVAKIIAILMTVWATDFHAEIVGDQLVKQKLNPFK
mgnify:CR=1 FL=1